MFNEPLILSLCGVVRERLLPCRVVVGWMDCIVYTDYVQPLSRYSLTFLASSFCFDLRKCFWLVFLSFPLLFRHAFFLPFFFFFFFNLWTFCTRLLACLIRAAILHFSFRLHLFEVVSAVLFLSFGVSCLLAWLGQPFFVCYQHLWFGLSFFATGLLLLLFVCLILSQAFVYSFFLTRPFLL